MPSAEEAAAAGFAPEDYDIEPAEVWPENWPIVQLFLRLSTQWIVGVNGATGLNYPSLYPLLDRAYPDPADWSRAFDELQIMEREALITMRD